MEAKSNLPNLPGVNDESWGDGYREKVELKKSTHKHKLQRVEGNRLMCRCGWSIFVSDPRIAEDILNKVNS